MRDRTRSSVCIASFFAIALTWCPESYAHNGSPDNFEHIAVDPNPWASGRVPHGQPYFAIFVTRRDDHVAAGLGCSLREAIQLVNYSYVHHRAGNFRPEQWGESQRHYGVLRILLEDCPPMLIRPGFTLPAMMERLRSKMPRGQWALYTENIQSWIILQEGEYTLNVEGQGEDEGWTGDLDVHAYPGNDPILYSEDGQVVPTPPSQKFCAFAGSAPNDPNNRIEFNPFACWGGVGILGAGATRTTINAQGIDRIFHHNKRVLPTTPHLAPTSPTHTFPKFLASNLYISGVRLTGGRADGKGSNYEAYNYNKMGGAVLAENRTLIENTLFSNNTADLGGALALMGYDENAPGFPPSQVDDSFFKNIIFLGNSATLGGGAMYSHNALLQDVDLAGNPNWNNYERLDQLQFILNRSLKDGGAVYLNGGKHHFKRASYLMNLSGGMGGAIYNHGYLKNYETPMREPQDQRPVGGELKVENTSFTGNMAVSTGGAVADRSFRSTSVNHSTLFVNFSSAGVGGIDNDVSYAQRINGNVNIIEAETQLKSSILAHNFSLGGGILRSHDCTGSIRSHGQNLMTEELRGLFNLNCAFGQNPSDRFATNPQLRLVPRLPFVPQLDRFSPAIDQADDLNVAGHHVLTDLLGRDREVDLRRSGGAFRSDIGAFEYQGLPIDFLSPGDFGTFSTVDLAPEIEKYAGGKLFQGAKDAFLMQLSKTPLATVLKAKAPKGSATKSVKRLLGELEFCEVHGWYGDGVYCDNACAKPDPDCKADRKVRPGFRQDVR